MRKLNLILFYITFSLASLSINFEKFDSDVKLLKSRSDFNNKKIYSYKQLQMDLKLIQRLLIEIHPNSEIYLDNGELTKLFNKSLKYIEDGMDYYTYYNFLHIILDKIGDGNIQLVHSKIKEINFKRASKVPFKIELVGNEVYFASGGFDIPFGAEILQINDISIDKILNKLSIYTFTDGESIAHKYRNLELSTNFSDFYFNYYGEFDSFNIKYLYKNRLNEVLIPSKNITEEDLEINNNQTVDNEILYKRLDSETAYIGLLGEIPFDYAKEEFEILFKALKRSKTKNLILDIRNYFDGDEDILLELLSYFISENIAYTYPAKFINQEIPYKEYILNSQEDLLALEKEMNETIFSKSINKFELKFSEKFVKSNYDNKFSGQIFILLNSSVVNNSVRFLSTLEHYTESISIGEETKGGALITNDKANLIYELPNTGIILKLPHKEIELQINQIYSFARGVIPDQIFLKNYDEFISRNKDTQLERLIWELEQDRLLEEELERIRLEEISDENQYIDNDL